jgi:hypothetical protein
LSLGHASHALLHALCEFTKEAMLCASKEWARGYVNKRDELYVMTLMLLQDEKKTEAVYGGP